MKYLSRMIGIVLVCAVFGVMLRMQGASAQTPAASARPPGIPAANWLPISNNLGFVVRHIVGSSTPTLSGYFMAKRGQGWWRLKVMQPHIARMRWAVPEATARIGL